MRPEPERVLRVTPTTGGTHTTRSTTKDAVGVVTTNEAATGSRRWVRKGAVLVPLHPKTQVQVKEKHRDPKTVMRYDHGRENLDQNAVNFLVYDEE